MPDKIVDYEDYDYKEFWSGKKRSYEHLSEISALKKLIFKNGTKFIDIGGGYGRLSNTYINLFPQIVILDYSLKNLSIAKKELSKRSKSKIFFVASDVYDMPFKNSTFDFAISIRLIHHLTQPQNFFNEISRILTPQSFFILEYANKRNLKRIGKFLIRKIAENPFFYKPSTIGKNIYNFHPKFISNKLKLAEFKILKILSVSNFRLNFIKKTINPGILSKIDSIVQLPLGSIKTGPSIFVLSQKRYEKTGFKKKNLYEKTEGTPSDSERIPWKCIYCKSDIIDEKEDEMICNQCGAKFPIIDGIYDFRKK